MLASLNTISLGSTRLGFSSFFFPIFWWRCSFERTKKLDRNTGDFPHSSLERIFIGFGWLIESRNFPYKLKRSSSNFLVSDWRIEVEKRFNVSAHSVLPQRIMTPNFSSSALRFEAIQANFRTIPTIFSHGPYVPCQRMPSSQRCRIAAKKCFLSFCMSRTRA